MKALAKKCGTTANKEKLNAPTINKPSILFIRSSMAKAVPSKKYTNSIKSFINFDFTMRMKGSLLMLRFFSVVYVVH